MLLSPDDGGGYCPVEDSGPGDGQDDDVSQPPRGMRASVPTPQLEPWRAGVQYSRQNSAVNSSCSTGRATQGELQAKEAPSSTDPKPACHKILRGCYGTAQFR